MLEEVHEVVFEPHLLISLEDDQQPLVHSGSTVSAVTENNLHLQSLGALSLGLQRVFSGGLIFRLLSVEAILRQPYIMNGAQPSAGESQ